jgi:hydroxymethylglutaryl-CoA reductase
MNTSIYQSITEDFAFRSKHGKQYKTKDLLIVCLIAELAGANSARKKEAYMEQNRRNFYLFLDIFWEKSPKKDTINRFINSIDVTKLQKLLNFYSSKSVTKNSFLSIDGKTVCSSGANMLNIFCQKTMQCIDKYEFSKGQEIECAYNFLMNNNLNKNTWVTLDAIHTQKKIMS